MKKLLKKHLCILSLTLLCLTSCQLFSSSEEDPEPKLYQGSYTTNYLSFTDEKLANQKPFNNPDSGFYKPTILCLTPNGIKNQNGDNYWLETYEKNSLVHLRCDISKFSTKANATYLGNKEITDCADQEIPSSVVNELQEIINKLREQGVNAIIRFCYSPLFSYTNDQNGKTIEVEPSLELMLNHIQALEPVLKNNPDVLSAVEVGMLGPWGEMHTTTQSKKQKNISALIDKFLSVTSKKTCILVRQPRYIYNWIAGNNEVDYNNEATGNPYNVNELSPTFAKDSNKKEATRVGLYNDGYLGTANDTGTYKNRDIEQKFLFYQGRKAMYGGEVAIGDANTDIYREYDSIKNDIFKTHLSYLNIDWNNNVIATWKNTNLDSGETLFEYVKKRMGARLVLQEIEYPEENIKPGTTFELSGKIKNDGAGNIIKEKVAELIFVNTSTENVVKEITLSKFPDVKTWYSKNPYDESESNIYDFNFNVTVPKDLEDGNYKIYLRLRTPSPSNFSEDKTRYCFRFSGSDDDWNSNIQANLLTTIKVNSQI